MRRALHRFAILNASALLLTTAGCSLFSTRSVATFVGKEVGKKAVEKAKEKWEQRDRENDQQQYSQGQSEAYPP